MVTALGTTRSPPQLSKQAAPAQPSGSFSQRLMRGYF